MREKISTGALVDKFPIEGLSRFTFINADGRKEKRRRVVYPSIKRLLKSRWVRMDSKDCTVYLNGTDIICQDTYIDKEEVLGSAWQWTRHQGRLILGSTGLELYSQSICQPTQTYFWRNTSCRSPRANVISGAHTYRVRSMETWRVGDPDIYE